MFVTETRYRFVLTRYREAFTALMKLRGEFIELNEQIKRLQDIHTKTVCQYQDLETENRNLWKLLHPKIKPQHRDKNGRFAKKEKK